MNIQPTATQKKNNEDRSNGVLWAACKLCMAAILFALSAINLVTALMAKADDPSNADTAYKALTILFIVNVYLMLDLWPNEKVQA